jgi:MFS family permease
MAVFGFSWVIPFAIGPLLAGLVMDNLDPNWLWYASGMVGLAAAGLFYLMELRVGRSRWAVVDDRLHVLEQLEQGRISAETASRLLEGMGTPEWERLTTPIPEAERRHVRIRVSDLASGAMKVDLRLPMALVNTVLKMGGQISPDLGGHHNGYLKELISRSIAQAGPQDIETDGERVEVSLE